MAAASRVPRRISQGKACPASVLWILGRTMFGPVRGPWPDESWKGWWGEDPPYHVPTFVLTHHPRRPLRMQGGTEFRFVTGGIHAALEQAKAAAGDKDIRLGGGVSTIQQYLQARLIDELHLAIAPVLLGRGDNLLGGIDLLALGYECVEHIPGVRAALHVIIRNGPRERRPGPSLAGGMGHDPFARNLVEIERCGRERTAPPDRDPALPGRDRARRGRTVGSAVAHARHGDPIRRQGSRAGEDGGASPPPGSHAYGLRNSLAGRRPRPRRTTTPATRWNYELLDWLRRVHQTTRWTASGLQRPASIWGAAGLLKGLPATSHWYRMNVLKIMGRPTSTCRAHSCGPARS